MISDIEFRTLKTIEDMKKIVLLQQNIWPGENPVPDHLLLTSSINGGVTIGAFKKDHLIGFVFGFIGLYMMVPNIIFSQRLFN